MFKRVLSIFSVLLLGASLLTSQAAFANADTSSAVGYWMTLDHKNHNAYSSVIQIIKGADGTLSGKIIHIFPEAGHKVTDKCVFCKGELHNTPILGMRLVWGFRPDPNAPGHYIDGHVLDPQSGNVYKCTMWLSNKGQQLTVHGYIGISLFGRSDVWLRTHPVSSTNTKAAKASK